MTRLKTSCITLMGFLIFLASTSGVQAIQDPYIVYGYVTYSDQTPASTHTVEVLTSNQSITTVSDSDGRYSVVLTEYVYNDTITLRVSGVEVQGVVNASTPATMINLTLPLNTQTPTTRRGGGGGFGVARDEEVSEEAETVEDVGETGSVGDGEQMMTGGASQITTPSPTSSEEDASSAPEDASGGMDIKMLIGSLSTLLGSVGLGIRYTLKHFAHKEEIKTPLLERIFH
jgi:hypothetical protein